MLQEILIAYMECAVWTEELDGYGFSLEARAQALNDIEQFMSETGTATAGISESGIGYDLWLSRNGLGSGFFDRGYDPEIEKVLMNAAQKLGTVHLYQNKTGTIEHE